MPTATATRQQKKRNAATAELPRKPAIRRGVGDSFRHRILATCRCRAPETVPDTLAPQVGRVGFINPTFTLAKSFVLLGYGLRPNPTYRVSGPTGGFDQIGSHRRLSGVRDMFLVGGVGGFRALGCQKMSPTPSQVASVRQAVWFGDLAARGAYQACFVFC